MIYRHACTIILPSACDLSRQNTRRIVAHALLTYGGGVLVDETNLQETVLRLAKDSAGLDNMAAKARRTALSFMGATQKTMDMVKNYERKSA